LEAAGRGLCLGIDLGRTWLRACLANAEGRVLRRSRLPAVAWQRLPEVLPRLRRRLRFSGLRRLTLGSTGLWNPESRANARRLLRPCAGRVVAVSDVELAHAAAFGGGPGLLVVAGTGSIAAARDRRGRWQRAGGWGQLLGDEGSGFWIGRAALRDPLLRRRLRLGFTALPPTPESVRFAASLAPRVLRLARADSRARRVRDAAVRHLTALARQAVRGLQLERPIAVCCWGGVFRDQALSAQFQRALGRRYQVIAPRLAADVAAARMRRRPDGHLEVRWSSWAAAVLPIDRASAGG
jgi:N-acetylglucosamine kinase-like BadF-type ATPase